MTHLNSSVPVHVGQWALTRYSVKYGVLLPVSYWANIDLANIASVQWTRTVLLAYLTFLSASGSNANVLHAVHFISDKM